MDGVVYASSSAYVQIIILFLSASMLLLIEIWVFIYVMRRIKRAWKETVSLMKTVYPYLIIGAAIGAAIHGVVPTEWIATHFGGDQWWLIPIAAFVGILLYIRLSTMIPISQILIAKGMSLGPVMALMISSAGASLPKLMLLNSIFRKKLLNNGNRWCVLQFH